MREEELAKKVKISKILQVLERKSAQEKESHDKVKFALETRAERAYRLRLEAIKSRVNIARKVIKKMDKVLQTKQDINKQKQQL